MLVVKIGGARGVDGDAVCADIAELSRTGCALAVVHGGSAEADDLGQRLGHAPRFLTATSGVRSRHTDSRTLEILTMALAGRINPSLVSTLSRRGVSAVGLTGLDGRLIVARRKPAVTDVRDGRVHLVRDDLTGRISGVNAVLLRTLIDGGHIPVISPPAWDPEHGAVNVDADRLAAAVAAALEADTLVLMTNVPGLLSDPNDPNSVVPTIHEAAIDRYLSIASGRMKLKLIAAREAVAGGVRRVTIADARVEGPLRRALSGRGTTVVGRSSQLESVPA